MKSFLLVLLGAVLASLVWAFWIANIFQEEAEQIVGEAINQNEEVHMEASQVAQLTALASHLSMDLLVLKTTPDEVHCMVRTFADMKYRKLIAHRSSIQSFVEPIINEYEELEEDASCSKH